MLQPKEWEEKGEEDRKSKGLLKQKRKKKITSSLKKMEREEKQTA